VCAIMNGYTPDLSALGGVGLLPPASGSSCSRHHSRRDWWESHVWRTLPTTAHLLLRRKSLRSTCFCISVQLYPCCLRRMVWLNISREAGIVKPRLFTRRYVKARLNGFRGFFTHILIIISDYHKCRYEG